MAEDIGVKIASQLLADVEAKGLKQVAKRMGVTAANLKSCLTKGSPTLRTIQRIAHAMDMRVVVALHPAPTLSPPPPRAQEVDGIAYGGRSFSGVTVDGVVIGSPEFQTMSDRDRAQLVLTAEARRRQAADDERWESYWAAVWWLHYNTYKQEQTRDNLPILPPEEWNAEKRVENQHREAYRRQHGWADGDPSDPALTDPRNLDSTYNPGLSAFARRAL